MNAYGQVASEIIDCDGLRIVAVLSILGLRIECGRGRARCFTAWGLHQLVAPLLAAGFIGLTSCGDVCTRSGSWPLSTA